MNRVIKKFCVFSFAFLALTNCGKRDFSGEYYTMFSHQIQDPVKMVSSDLTELSLFKLNIYKSNNVYAGDVDFIKGTWDFDLFQPMRISSSRTKLVLTNIRVKGDTLLYLMTDNMGLNLNGALIKSDSIFHVLDIGLSGENFFTKYNPLFRKSINNTIKYINIPKNHEDSIRKVFVLKELNVVEFSESLGKKRSQEKELLKQMIK